MTQLAKGQQSLFETLDRSENSLSIPESFSSDDVMSIAQSLIRVNQTTPWFWGDLLLRIAKDDLMKSFSEVLRESGLDSTALQNAMRVCDLIPAEHRKLPPILFGHHETIVFELGRIDELNLEKIKEWLGKAEAGEMKISQLRSAIRDSGRYYNTVQRGVPSVRAISLKFQGLINKARGDGGALDEDLSRSIVNDAWPMVSEVLSLAKTSDMDDLQERLKKELC